MVLKPKSKKCSVKKFQTFFFLIFLTSSKVKVTKIQSQIKVTKIKIKSEIQQTN